MLEILLKEQDEIEKHMALVQNIALDHLKNNHGGLPATVCHKCLNYREGVRVDLANLQDIQKKIDNLSNNSQT